MILNLHNTGIMLAAVSNLIDVMNGTATNQFFVVNRYTLTSNDRDRMTTLQALLVEHLLCLSASHPVTDRSPHPIQPTQLKILKLWAEFQKLVKFPEADQS